MDLSTLCYMPTIYNTTRSIGTLIGYHHWYYTFIKASQLEQYQKHYWDLDGLSLLTQYIRWNVT